jgi:hypothetical protein
MTAKKNEAIGIGGECPTNGAAEDVAASAPYVVTVTLAGTTDLLFHRWNCEAVEGKAKAAKGSAAKKTDNLESYVYRDDAGELCLPGEYIRQAAIHAAKFRQDPRSPRKSAMDLFKAGLIALTPLASLGTKSWHYEDRRRAVVQRNAVTRVRPAIKEGWNVAVEFMVNLPQYISPALLQEVLVDAGRLVGVGDFRPTYGRFRVVGFAVKE